MKVYERIHKVDVGEVAARVWCQVSGLTSQSEADAQEAAILNIMNGIVFDGTSSEALSIVGAIEAIAALKFCNAVEFTFVDGTAGMLIYPDWP